MLEKRQLPVHAALARADGSRTAESLDLLSLLRTLWRGKWLILLSMLAAIALGAYYAFEAAVPRYTSTAVVALLNRQSQVIDLEGAIGGLTGDEATINTEEQVMLSRQLHAQVVAEMALLEDPEFNPALATTAPYSQRWVKEQIFGPDRPLTEQEAFDRTVDRLLATIDVDNMPGSYVFEISAETTSPEKSAAIANKVAELYIQDQLKLKMEATANATAWLGERVSVLKEELEAAESRLKEFTASSQLVSPEALGALGLQLKDLRSRVADKRQTVERIQARLAALQEGVGEASPNELAAISDDPALIRIAEQLAQGRGSEELFESRLEQVIETAEAQLEREALQIDLLQKSVSELEQRIESQSEELVVQQQLEREVAANTLIYESFLSRMKELSVQQGLQEPDARVLSAAVVRPSPSQPKTGLVLALSGVLGLIFGSTLVLMREATTNVFRTSEELERVTGLPVLGQVPVAPSTRRKTMLRHIAEQPTSAYSEAVRNLRTSMLLANANRPPEVIMITSSIPGEGKTTQSLSLSHNLATMGRKVLLIEADIRRRTFGEYLDVPNGTPGLVTAVNDGAPLPEVVQRHGQLGMDILLGEKSQENAADFFSSDRFHAFVERAKTAYDFVVLDTPPVLAVPDARVIGQAADMIVYVVRWDHTGRAEVQSGLGSLESVQLQVNGLILSQVDPQGLQRYGHGGGYGTYGKSYYTS